MSDETFFRKMRTRLPHLADVIRWSLRDFFKNTILFGIMTPNRIRVAALNLLGSKISKTAVLESHSFVGSGALVIGERTVIGREAFLDPTAGIYIGSDVWFGPRVVIITASHKVGTSEATRVLRLPSTQDRRPVFIGNEARIGPGTVILPGVIVGDGVVIEAQSVVRHDCPPYTRYAGIPAKLVFSESEDA